MKKFLAILVCTLLFIPSVSASDVSVSMTCDKAEYSAGENIICEITGNSIEGLNIIGIKGNIKVENEKATHVFENSTEWAHSDYNTATGALSLTANPGSIGTNFKLGKVIVSIDKEKINDNSTENVKVSLTDVIVEGELKDYPLENKEISVVVKKVVETTKSTSPQPENPKTGDIDIAIILTLIIASSLAVVYSRKKAISLK